jgi:hypothetical protein
MNLDRKYLICALSFAAVGLCLGIYMAATQNHTELVAHAHILMVGFVVSLVYGIIHRLWLDAPGRVIANVQFYLHQAAAIAMSVGLFLLYGNLVPMESVDPVLGISSAGVLVGMLLMLYMVIRSGTRKTA